MIDNQEMIPNKNFLTRFWDRVTHSDHALTIAISLAFALIYGDSTVLSIALPSIQEQYNATNEITLWVVNSYMLVRAVLVFASGRLSDMFSHSNTFIFGLVVLILASFGCAVSPTIGTLVFFRSLQGMGATFAFVSGMSLITANSPKEQVASKIGFVLSLGLSSMAIAPVIGGIIVRLFTWQWIFYLNVIIGSLAVIISAPILNKHEKITEPKGKFDYTGFLLSAAFTAAITLAFENSNTWGWLSGRFITVAMIGLLACILFYFIESKKNHPIVNLKLFSLPNFLSGTLVASFVQVSVILVIFIGVFLQSALGYTPMMAGILLLPMVLTGVVFANVGGYLAGKFGSKFPLVLGTGSICLGFIITILMFEHITYYKLLPLLIFSGVGMFMISGPVRTAMLSETPKNQHGMTNAILTGTRSIISVIGFSITAAIIVNVQFYQTKSKLLLLIPTISNQQIHEFMGILSHTSKGFEALSHFDISMQISIKNIILSSYINGFFWALIFVGILEIISFFLAVYVIKK